MGTHAKYGPSKLDGLSKCVRFKHIEMKSSSDEGTELHEAFEDEDLDGLDEEQSGTVQRAIDYTNQVKASGDFIEEREFKLELRDLTYGTADRILVSSDRRIGHVMDFKATRVLSDHEWQVETYGAALLEREPLMEEVTMHIVAPRLDAPIVTKSDRSLLAKVRERIEALYERIEDFTTPPAPHQDCCVRCQWAHKCPALTGTIVKAVELAGLPVPSSFDPAALVSDRDRCVAQALAAFFENWAKEVKKFNAAYMQQTGQKELYGVYRLIEKSTGVRISKESTGACFLTLRAAGVTDDQLISACRLSLPDLAKVLAETGNKTEKAYKEWFKTLLADFVTEGRTAFLQKAMKIDERTLLAEHV